MLRPLSPKRGKCKDDAIREAGQVPRAPLNPGKQASTGTNPWIYLLLCLAVLAYVYVDIDVMTSTFATGINSVMSKHESDFVHAKEDSQTGWWSSLNKVLPSKGKTFENKLYKSFAKPNAESCNSLKKTACPVFLVGSTPDSFQYVLSFFRSLDSSFNVHINDSINDLSSSLFTIDLAQQVLSETAGSLDYSFDQLSQNVTKTLNLALESLRRELYHVLDTFRMDSKSATVVFGFALGIYFLPVFADERLFGDCIPKIVVSVQNGLDAAFQDIRETAKFIGPSLSSEKVIDTLCLARARPLKSAMFEEKNSPLRLTPNIHKYELYQAEDILKRFDKTVTPCTITEIPILRNSQIWATANYGAIQFLNTLPGEGYILRVEDIALSKDSLQFYIMKLLGFCPPISDNETRPLPELHKVQSVITLPDLTTWREDARAHHLLLSQIKDLIGVEIFSLFGYDKDESSPLESSIIKNAPELSQMQRIDSGRCWKYSIGTLKEYQKNVLTFQYGHCLPNFIILGVQKASTDELAVWLNFNVHSRRLDGGVEIHYFDCVARGMGKERESCKRFRDQSMHWDSRSPELKQTKDSFTWTKLARKSPYIDDIWGRYSKLGNLNYRDYTQRHTILFEKTPAYFDLAHEMDMYRLLPSVKLVIVLREPAARLFSGYWQSCNGKLAIRKGCNLSFFGKMMKMALAGEENSIEDEEFKRGLEHGKYAKHINRWRRAYADDQILIVFASHFKENPQAVVYFIECFLGQTDKMHHIYKPHEHNGYKVLGHYSKAEHPSHKVELPEKLRKRIQEYYKPWNERLLNLLRNSSIISKPLPNQIKYNGNFEYPPWLGS